MKSLNVAGRQAFLRTSKEDLQICSEYVLYT